jgi:hypothetical protein
MTVEYEAIDLPVFSRPVAVTHEAGGAGDNEPPHAVGRVLDRFSGVLGVGVTVRDWPPPALSYLTLDRLAAAALADSEQGRRPAPRETRSTRETDTEPEPETGTDTDEDESEPRVREVIREGTGPSGERSPRIDPPRIEAPGRPAADRLGIVGDPTSADGTVGPGESIQSDLDRSLADDRHVVTSQSSIEERPTGQTERRERTVRREVVQPEESRRRRADEPSPGPGGDRPGTDDERVTGSRTRRQPGESGSSVESSDTVEERVTERTVERGSGWNRGGDDRSGDRPSIAGFDDDQGSDSVRAPSTVVGVRAGDFRSRFNASGPVRAPPTGAGPSVRRWSVPSMTVSRAAPRVLTTVTGPDRPGSVPESSRSRPPEGRDRMEGGTTVFERSLRGEAPSLAGRDSGAADRGVRMEPLEIPIRAPGTTGPGGAETAPTVAGAGERRVDPGGSGGPRMTVRRSEDSGGVTGDDAVGDRSGGRTDSTDAAGSQIGWPPRGNAGRAGESDSQRIEDVLDIDRLVDRLMRAFERKARIERERRGR